ncbi:RND superfamily putative drug exporter [Kribbella orskensis]|uniref:RND superfamily putative drug exporter n=1 Tax=Kribbella orskensis TaxID=2512216 RepID=A0ABY2BYW2_9ACTN|nr:MULTISPECIES: MMPL family transporter [Kribbella]TCN43994.1 RND superfamily putative drug exporter [Kribbella sp. VKM Ac-2500]TCO32228.1 RND superfamily putative drug exporter [Kribbella orskensis]
MANLLYRLGRFSYQRRRLVAAIWTFVLVLLGVGALTLGGQTANTFSIPGTESQRALDALAKDLPAASGASATVVVKAPAGKTLADPTIKAAVGATVAKVNQLPEVVGAVDPFTSKAISPDGATGLISVQFAKPADELAKTSTEAYDHLKSLSTADLQVVPGGQVVGGPPEIGSTEVIGVAIAAVVLVVTFGSLVAAGMTLLTALIGVLAGMAGLFLVTSVVDVSSTAPILALMLGLAVGIDYALFISSRHRTQLAAGMDEEESVARATATAGSAVLFAGATVVIALAGLSLVGVPFLTAMGLAAAATVLTAVLVALTLLPAMLGFVGRRVLPRKIRKTAATPATEGFGFRWARLVTRFRIPVVAVGIIGLGVLSIPTQDMRLALPDGASAAAGTNQRVAYDLAAAAFGPGSNGPLVVVVKSDSAATTGGLVEQVMAKSKGLEDVVAVAPGPGSADGSTRLVSVIPASGPASEQTADLVKDLRTAVHPLASGDASISITGNTAVGVDVSNKLTKALPTYLLVVIGLSFLLLLLAFRSVLVPLKATLGFLLTIGATFGITVAVFQKGWGASLLGVDSPGPLVSFLPIIMMGVLFGLAMDYEVFIVSRVREEFVHGKHATEATIAGVGHGARVVTAAALIMAAVFAGFILVEDPIIKTIGFGLTIGVLIDAFVVRMTLVPAVLTLLGDRAWFFPRWLDRITPKVDIEGENLRTTTPKPTDKDLVSVD